MTWSVQFSHSVVSDSLQSPRLQHTRLPCPSPTPEVYPNSCPLSWWCHPTISSSVVSISSCPQSFPASGSFQMSQLFTSGGQNIGVSASASVLLMNTQNWSPLGWISSTARAFYKYFLNPRLKKNPWFLLFSHLFDQIYWQILNVSWPYLSLSHPFPGSSAGKKSACNTEDPSWPSSAPGLGRSPREGTGYPLQYS